MGHAPWPPSLPYRLPPPHDRYELFQLLGAGGQGQVYRALDSRHADEERAVKILWPRRPGQTPAPPSEDFVELFLAEAEYGKDVRSSYLGHTLDVIDLRGRVLPNWPPVGLVMPYYRCSLADLVGQGTGKFPLRQVIAWTRHLALGVAAMHEARRPRVHRDLKPGNVMFQLPAGRLYEGPNSLEDADVVITDFGATGPLYGPSPLTVFRNGDGEADPFKDPQFFPPPGEPVSEEGQLCHPGMDLYALGELLRVFARLADAPCPWLEKAARECQHPDPAERPRAADLLPRLSPDWDDHLKLLRDTGNWRPEDHEGFVGRAFIIEDEFERFARACRGRGGIFVVEGPAGVGKSALLTKWAERTGRPFGYYFRYRDNVTQADAMPRALAKQLCHAFEVADPIPESADELTAFVERVCRTAADRPDRPGRLMIFIDGLDEADDPARAAGFIPKALPAQVFVVASSRPHAKETKDHVALLRAAGATVFPLRADDPRNRDDLETFLKRRLAARIAPAEAQALADRCGGLFLLARLVSEAIEAPGGLTVAEALEQSRTWDQLDPTQRLFDYYQQSWDRICGREEPESLGTLAGLMAAAQGWVSETQITAILGWYEREEQGRRERYWTWARLRNVLLSLTWFLERRDGPARSAPFYQIRHQSVRDYLLSPSGPVPPAGLAEMHRAVGNYYRREAERSGRWTRLDPYGRFQAVHHLLLAGDAESHVAAARLLCDLDYLEGTLGDELPEAESGTRLST